MLPVCRPLCLLLLVFAGCAGTDDARPVVPADDLYDPSPARRSEAVAAVAQTQDTRYLGRLIELLEDSDPAVRALANQTLEQLTGRRTAFTSFGPAEERRTHADGWRAWMSGHAVQPRVPTPAPPRELRGVGTPEGVAVPRPAGSPYGAVRGSD